MNCLCVVVGPTGARPARRPSPGFPVVVVRLERRHRAMRGGILNVPDSRWRTPGMPAIRATTYGRAYRLPDRAGRLGCR
ncbi:hypothetical protein AvCA_22230 [Azotobacter vinelandii CA]|uniref:Uncharacterized protein n=2 Tax=Azotobacter vinelandii TaxID=354 RepID=C1DGA3_AZOVD|nr:hypothetical protein Avin_22230 [Azotobacter vinelandii DJ]AGK16736.1 hypothetical protein AvCA_22230 [Azotobacter vinelandii CA]AGK20486.1 hypothetical protein AvCA6_22230 [Azotobacter vinelandii CA6]